MVGRILNNRQSTYHRSLSNESDFEKRLTAGWFVCVLARAQYSKCFMQYRGYNLTTLRQIAGRNCIEVSAGYWPVKRL